MGLKGYKADNDFACPFAFYKEEKRGCIKKDATSYYLEN